MFSWDHETPAAMKPLDGVFLVVWPLARAPSTDSTLRDDLTIRTRDDGQNEAKILRVIEYKPPGLSGIATTYQPCSTPMPYQTRLNVSKKTYSRLKRGQHLSITPTSLRGKLGSILSKHSALTLLSPNGTISCCTISPLGARRTWKIRRPGSHR